MKIYPCLLLLILPLYGCWLLPLPQRVDVLLPEIPPGWPGEAFHFSLRYSGEDGEIRWSRDHRPGETISLTLSRGSPQPLCAYPHPRDVPAPVTGFRCAGAVYPLEGGITGPLVLTWSGGFLAELLLKLSPEQRIPLNWVGINKRLEEACCGDPWLIDGDKLLEALAFRRFTGSTLRIMSLYTWIPDSACEDWWWGDPMLDGIDWSALGEDPPSPGECRLYPGIHRATSPDGTASLVLEISETGWRSVVLPEGTVAGGGWKKQRQ